MTPLDQQKIKHDTVFFYIFIEQLFFSFPFHQEKEKVMEKVHSFWGGRRFLCRSLGIRWFQGLAGWFGGGLTADKGLTAGTRGRTAKQADEDTLGECILQEITLRWEQGEVTGEQPSGHIHESK